MGFGDGVTRQVYGWRGWDCNVVRVDISEGLGWYVVELVLFQYTALLLL